MIKKYYSPEEVIQTLNQAKIKITLSDLKDLCIRESLTPSIYFEGNLVCIKDDKYQDAVNNSSPIAHCQSVSWSKIFKGYIHSNIFSNFLESRFIREPKADVFFVVDKIVEDLSEVSTSLPLEQDEYIKAFPRKYDDKIQRKQWVKESYHFEGNAFSSRDIVFHHDEVEQLINTSQISTAADQAPPLFFSYDIYSYLQAASILAGYNPVETYQCYGTDGFHQKFPKFANAYDFLDNANKTGNLPSHRIPAETLKNYLREKGQVIPGFNDSASYRSELKTNGDKIIKKPQGKSQGKAEAQVAARAIATHLWKNDKEQQIKTGEMCQLIWNTLCETEYMQELPDKPESLKDWFKDIAPGYAKQGGRPKEI